MREAGAGAFGTRPGPGHVGHNVSGSAFESVGTAHLPPTTALEHGTKRRRFPQLLAAFFGGAPSGRALARKIHGRAGGSSDRPPRAINSRTTENTAMMRIVAHQTRCWRALPLAILALGPVPDGSAGQELAYGASIQYARGSYIFTHPTETFSFYGSLGLRTGRFRLTLGLPVLFQDSRAVTLVGGVPVPTGGPDHEAVARRERGRPVPMGSGRGGHGSGSSGFGRTALPVLKQELVDTVEAPGSHELHVADPLLGAAFEVRTGSGTIRSVELLASVKPPVANLESGVGTEAWDAGVGMSVVLGRGRILVFSGLTYWWNGDMPNLELRDGVTWDIGAGVPVHERVSVLVDLWGGARVIDNVEPPVSLSTTMSLRLSDSSSLGAGLAVGLSESTPDVSISLSWRATHRWFARNPGTGATPVPGP